MGWTKWKVTSEKSKLSFKKFDFPVGFVKSTFYLAIASDLSVDVQLFIQKIDFHLENRVLILTFHSRISATVDKNNAQTSEKMRTCFRLMTLYGLILRISPTD